VGLGKGEGEGTREGGPVPVGEGRMAVVAEEEVVDSSYASGVTGAAALAPHCFGDSGFGVSFSFGRAGVGSFVKGCMVEELRYAALLVVVSMKPMIVTMMDETEPHQDFSTQQSTS